MSKHGKSINLYLMDGTASGRIKCTLANWTEAVVFTTSNNSFGPTEISYLENRFCRLSVESNRYDIKNGNGPTPGNITEEKESELEEFIDYAKILMGTFGHKIFEPLLNVSTTPANEPVNSNEEYMLYLKTAKADTTGRRTNEGFVVLKGSTVSMSSTKSCPDTIHHLRKQYNDRINNNILTEDTLFKSPSAAAGFVTYASANGLIMWMTEDSRTLKDIENSEE